MKNERPINIGFVGLLIEHQNCDKIIKRFGLLNLNNAY
jgi:hypothetical protein